MRVEGAFPTLPHCHNGGRERGRAGWQQSRASGRLCLVLQAVTRSRAPLEEKLSLWAAFHAPKKPPTSLELLNISSVLVEVPGHLMPLPGLNAFAPEHQLKGWPLAPNPLHQTASHRRLLLALT